MVCKFNFSKIVTMSVPCEHISFYKKGPRNRLHFSFTSNVTFLQTQYKTVFTVLQKLMKNITILFNLFDVNYHEVFHSLLLLLA